MPISRPASIMIGHEGEGFHFDNEAPQHRALTQDVRIARALVTNARVDRIHRRWRLCDAVALAVGRLGARAKRKTGRRRAIGSEIDGAWHAMTLGGLRPVDPNAPVMHVSYYEADAFARWAGKDLPTEVEWEVAARHNLIDDAFGIVWQWTRSAYLPYPGYRAPEGALGEYNGKFMVNQMVLRGSSLATPRRPCARDLSQFLSSAGALAIQRAQARGVCVNHGSQDPARSRRPLAACTGAGRRPIASFADDVIAGLSASPKRIPPKYFYDSEGSRLFEDITAHARILSDPQRERDPAHAGRRDRAVFPDRRGAGRIRHRAPASRCAFCSMPRAS